MIEVTMGVLVALITILIGRLKNCEHWLYSVSLLSLPIIYMCFGFFAEGNYIVLKEFLFGLPFILVGMLALFYSFKYSAYIIAILWLAHGGYDLYHNYLFINSAVWSWYPAFCAAVDLFLGLYLFYSASLWPQSNMRMAIKNT